MAKKKENYSNMKGEELEKKLAGLREDLRSLHFKMEGARSKNVKEAGSIRKNIARVLTAMNQK
jgi:ribosomal protein L29